jgi:hypothetical protein
MGEASSNSDPTLPPRKGESDATQPMPINPGPPPDQPPPTYVPPRPPATYVPPRQPPTYVPPRQPPTEPPRRPGADAPRQPPTIVGPRQPQPGASPPYQPTMVPHEPTMYAPPHEPTMYAPPPESSAPQPPAPEVMRYGPGVPASQAAVSESQAGVAAESVWRSGRQPGPPPGQSRLRRRLGLLLTVILLVAAGVVVYLRFFDHPSLHVTGVTISPPTSTGCTVNVTGRIDTNGGAGTVSYQWVFQPQTQVPQPLHQSLAAGQHAVDVTVSVEGQGHGTVTQGVTLDVLSPGTGTASTKATISC